MTSVLLLGAGFSRNWGGWLASEVFEYLLGCPEVSTNAHLRALLWRHHPLGGFEDALAELQAEFKRSGNKEIAAHLRTFQTVIARMFTDMNEALFENVDFEFQHQQRDKMVGRFLTQFDAIFTLNQDLLLEHHYLGGNIGLLGGRSWDGSQLPGLERIRNADPMHENLWSKCTWRPAVGDFSVAPRAQPFFKLHGSSNWQEPTAGPLLIMGGDKQREIGMYPILNWNFQQFEEHLWRGDTRLMVIGYGFRDAHINVAISNAVEKAALKMFLISPQGTDLARNLNTIPPGGLGYKVSALEEMFQSSLIGASRRSLREIFGGDAVEFNKVNRFFQ